MFLTNAVQDASEASGLHPTVDAKEAAKIEARVARIQCFKHRQ